MARLTYSFDANSPEPQGPKALGQLIVRYWQDVVGKSAKEVEALTSTLHRDLSALFEETNSGEVKLELLSDSADTVHIAIPKPAADLTRYQSEGFFEGFGNSIVFGCGRGKKIAMVSQSAEVTPLRKNDLSEKKAA